MNRSQEFEIKCERVRRFLSENGLDGVVLSRTDNFAWLGCGADSVVNSAGESGVGTLVAAGDSVALVANNIETERLMTEELAGLGISRTVTFPWHNPAERDEKILDLIGSRSFVSDNGAGGLPPCPAGFESLRFQLTESEIERYIAVSLDTNAAMEAAARAVEHGMAEADVAALVSAEHRARGLLPIVVLVAADDRIRRWRHPLPKHEPVEQYVMMVVCARRQGLVAAMTRFVHFGPMPRDLARRHRAVCEVDAAMIAATRPGRTAAEVFGAAQTAYEKAGFPGEWQYHHQGGAIGYQPREYIAHATCAQPVVSDQAFAWNPSICGTKSEDTILVHEDGFELLTSPSDAWPVLKVEAGGQVIPRANMLVK